MVRRIAAAFTAFAFLLAATGCSHRVVITTEPQGAKVFVDDQMIGMSPASFVEKSGMNKNYKLKIEKEGFTTLDTTLTQTINPMYAAIAAGACLFLACPVGLFFMMSLEDQYYFTLVPLEDAPPKNP